VLFYSELISGREITEPERHNRRTKQMKAVFLGGGAHRLLPIMRSALGCNVFDGGEIFLYDLNVPRAEAMARMIERTPEFKKDPCKITYDKPIEKGLDGADFVSAVLLAGSPYTFIAGGERCLKHGFSGTDNISLNGAFLALKGASVILGLAKKMEKYCPTALFADFANPVSVFSGAVNKYTKIKCLGICQGYQNHFYDLTRIMGKDEACYDYKVKVAGINHFSFIMEGSYKGKDIHKLVAAHIEKKNWKKVKWNKSIPLDATRRMQRGLEYFVRLFNEFDALLFSNEGDGIMHVFHEDYMEDFKKGWHEKNCREIMGVLKKRTEARAAEDMKFKALAEKDLDDRFWKTYPERNSNFDRHDNDIISKLLRAVAGIREEEIVGSKPNEGAVTGFEDRILLEFSQRIYKKKITPEKNLYVPGTLYGLLSALANYQTLLADAIATDDPKKLYHALYAYPVKQGYSETRQLWKELLEINRNEISKSLYRMKDYIR